jgi:hypothetical protein
MPVLPENSNTTTDNKLLQLVSTEIARDGGASLVSYFLEGLFHSC